MVSAQNVAEYIIWSSHESGSFISNLKLQKLLYYVQAWHLAVFQWPGSFRDREAEPLAEPLARPGSPGGRPSPGWPSPRLRPGLLLVPARRSLALPNPSQHEVELDALRIRP